MAAQTNKKQLRTHELALYFPDHKFGTRYAMPDKLQFERFLVFAGVWHERYVGTFKTDFMYKLRKKISKKQFTNLPTEIRNGHSIIIDGYKFYDWYGNIDFYLHTHKGDRNDFFFDPKSKVEVFRMGRNNFRKHGKQSYMTLQTEYVGRNDLGFLLYSYQKEDLQM